ncbi:hypothetical protein MKFW12EY_05990 [Methylomonas koyamae]|nr:hypothetical protein MKFW12EY_05990 [Methylomonas koyamae]
MKDAYFDNCKGIPLGLACDLTSPNFKQTYDHDSFQITLGDFNELYQIEPKGQFDRLAQND